MIAASIAAIQYPAPLPREEWTREHVLDVAAAATCDSWPLAGNRDLLEAVCGLAGDLAMEALRDARVVAAAALELYTERAAHAETRRRLADALAEFERLRVAPRAGSTRMDVAA